MSKNEHENAKNKDGNLKKKYSDMPRYKAIFGYEKEFVSNFNTLIQNMSKDIVKELASLAGVTKNK